MIEKYLTEDEIKKYTKRFVKNEVIFELDQILDSYYVVIDGVVAGYHYSSAGKVQLVNKFSNGASFAEAHIFSNDKRAQAAAVIDSKTAEVLIIPLDVVFELIGRNPEIARNLLEKFAKRIIDLSTKLKIISYTNIRSRISQYILIMLESSKNSKYVSIPFNRNHWASYLNVSRPALSRELAKLEAEGIIEFYKNDVKIFDLQKLRDIVEK